MKARSRQEAASKEIAWFGSFDHWLTLLHGRSKASSKTLPHQSPFPPTALVLHLAQSSLRRIHTKGGILLQPTRKTATNWNWKYTEMFKHTWFSSFFVVFFLLFYVFRFWGDFFFVWFSWINRTIFNEHFGDYHKNCSRFGCVFSLFFRGEGREGDFIAIFSQIVNWEIFSNRILSGIEGD